MAEAKREIRLILPVTDNDDGSLRDVHTILQGILSLNYGGFTRTIGRGGWYDDGTIVAETVAIYDVAVPDNQQTYEELVRLARMLCIKARQEAVYLRWTNGYVRMVKDQPLKAPEYCPPDSYCPTCEYGDVCHLGDKSMFVKPKPPPTTDTAKPYVDKHLVPPQPEPEGWYHGPTIGQAVDKAVEATETKGLSPLAQALSALAELHTATQQQDASQEKITGLRKDCPSAPDACGSCTFNPYCW